MGRHSYVALAAMGLSLAFVIAASPAKAPVKSRPKPKAPPTAIAATSPGSWITTDDYPIRALRDGKQGQVGFRLDVSLDGRVSKCSITQPSSSPDLDQATCTLVTQRARFQPMAKPGVFASRVHWVLPPDAGLPPASAPQPIAGIVSPAEVARLKKLGDLLGIPQADWNKQTINELQQRMNFPAAFSTMAKVAEAGNKGAITLVGASYLSGFGLAKDDAKAVALLQRASDMGFAPASFALGVTYLKGTHVAPDTQRALQLLRKAADGGSIVALHVLGLVQVTGEGGVPVNIDRAIQSLEMAERAGYTASGKFRALLHLNKDFAESIAGKPLWQPGVAMAFLGNVQIPHVTDFCKTWFASSRGGYWEIDWGGTTSELRAATTLILTGRIKNARDRQISFVLLEDNNRYSPAETREVFRNMNFYARRLHEVCTGQD